MLILGRKYNFTSLERHRLKKNKHSLNLVKYRDKKPQDVLLQIQSLISSDKVTTIVLNTKAKVDDEIIKYLTSLQFSKNIKIITIEKFLEDYLHKCYIPEDHTDLHYLEDIKPFNKWQYFQKRCVDYTVSIGLIIVSFPVVIYSIYRIKKESPGGIFFRQDRVGKNRVDFKCLKFRSMHEDSHHDPYTRENDSRIFPWGNTMRKVRIDEIAQILNVIKGEMHIIGPRAEWNILVENYEKEIPYYHERHLVAPGATGWAQVNYPYGANIEDTKQKLMYDLYYMKYWSLTLELKIVWKTIMTVLGRKGV